MICDINIVPHPAFAAVRGLVMTMSFAAIAPCISPSTAPAQTPNQQPVRPASFTQKGRFVSFVMTNTVFGNGGQQLARHEIVFDGGRAYDFSVGEDRYVTVFDPASQTATLLDRESKTKSIVAGESLLEIAAKAETMLAEQGKAAEVGIGATIKASPDGNEFTVQYGDTSYTVHAEPVRDRLVSIVYAQFIDMASRLDLARGAGPPPFARLRVHEQIQAGGRVPVTTTLVRSIDGSDQTITATHQRSDITDPQRQRINEVAGMMTLYQVVELAAFSK